MMAPWAEVVLFYPLLPDTFMRLRSRLPPAGFLWKVAGQLSSFARRRLRQKNKNVFQQPGGIVDAPLGADLCVIRLPSLERVVDRARRLGVLACLDRPGCPRNKFAARSPSGDCRGDNRDRPCPQNKFAARSPAGDCRGDKRDRPLRAALA